jgi:hypothetical protein
MRAEADMLDEVQTFWQELTPETQSAVQTGSVLVAALLGGHVLGSMVARGLRAKNFDAALRMPGASPSGTPEHGITPTFVGGMLVRLTVWAAAAWWLAHTHGWTDVAATLKLALSRTWAVAAMLVAALSLGSLLSQRLIDCLGGARAAADPAHLRNGHGTAGPQRGAAGAVGAAAYFLVVLLVLLVAADFFEWPLTRGAAVALWQLAENLLIAGAALLVGFLGARWARDLAVTHGTVTPEQRAGNYTALGIMAVTTVVAIGVLLSRPGMLIGLAVIAALGLSLWLLRGHLPDVFAGLQLRTQKVREVWFEGEPWHVTDVGFLTTQVTRGGAVHRLQNRLVLDARLNAAPGEPAAR